MYALLDWDSTLRTGATIFTLMQFLCDKGVIPPRALEEKAEIIETFRRGEISHDELSSQINLHYLSCLRGLSEERYNALLAAYLQQDAGPHIPTTEVLVPWLRSHAIDAVVVSGSPLRALQPHFPWIGVVDAFALVEGVTDGVMDGTRISDGGCGKESAAQHCRERFGATPLLAMGDSESDYPLLRQARMPIMVGDCPLPEDCRWPCRRILNQQAEGASQLRTLLEELDRILQEEKL